MNIQLQINATIYEIEIAPSETLFSAIRQLGFYGIKFGDEDGLTGADTVLLDGKPVNAGSCWRRKPKAITSSRLKRSANIPIRVGKRPMGCIRFNKLSLRMARSNADTARPHKSLPQNLCSIKIQIQVKLKSAKQSPECCADAPDILNQFRRYYAPRRSCAAMNQLIGNP